MKIEITEKKKKMEYPWIGIGCNGTIVLFIDDKKGIVLNNTNSEYRIGEYSNCWNMDFFKPFTGTIALSND